MIEIQTLVDFFQSYGYVAVFGILLLCGLGLPVPEDISLIAGGIISGLGYTDVHLMIVVSMAGVLLGDSIMYNLGRMFGERFFNKRIGGKLITHARYDAIQKWFEKYHRWVVFGARFMPGLRAPIFITTGMTRFVSFTAFIIIDGTAALISVPLWIYLGYYGATNREWLIRWLSRSQYGILIVIALVAIALVTMALIRRKIRSINGKIKKNHGTGTA